jgi:hypothetical protein
VIDELQGPLEEVANVPAAELELSETVVEELGAWESATVIGADGLPAVSVCGPLGNDVDRPGAAHW